MSNQTKRKPIAMSNQTKRSGFVTMEIIIYLIIAGIILGGLFLVIYPSIRSNVNTNEMKSEFTTITQGLNQYYSNNYQYPKASSWSWDNANTYISPSVKIRGWQYSCSGSRITLTTPALGPKTLQRLSEAFKKSASGLSVNGNKINVYLDNKPCP